LDKVAPPHLVLLLTSGVYLAPGNVSHPRVEMHSGSPLTHDCCQGNSDKAMAAARPIATEPKPESVWDLLSGTAGLRIYDIEGRGPLSRDAFADSLIAGELWNYVAHSGSQFSQLPVLATAH